MTRVSMEEQSKLFFTLTIKSMNREYWCIDCKPINKIPVTPDEGFHYEWEYSISNETSTRPFLVGHITGQWDEVPSASNIWQNALGHFTTVAMDFVKYS